VARSRLVEARRLRGTHFGRLNRHPEALGAPLCATSHRKSASADLRT